MSENLKVLEMNAAAQRALLAADIEELRFRARPSSIAADLKDTAKRAVAPLANTVANVATCHPLQVGLIAAMAGAASALPRKANSQPVASFASQYSRHAAGALMPLGKTLGLVGLGVLAGAALGRRMRIGDEERRVMSAVMSDLHRIFVNTSVQHIDDILNGNTKYANAAKVALAGIAVLTQRK